MSDGLLGPGLLWRLRRRLVGTGRTRVQYECRRCGHTLGTEPTACPDCGAIDVARYEL